MNKYTFIGSTGRKHKPIARVGISIQFAGLFSSSGCGSQASPPSPQALTSTCKTFAQLRAAFDLPSVTES